MTDWAGDRTISVVLTAAAGMLFALRLPPRVARLAWVGVWIAALAHALALNLQPTNLVHPNLVHYYLGSKYAFPYGDFYRLFEAASGRPPVNIRDLDRPNLVLNAQPQAQRAYYIDLMRRTGVEFDRLAPTETLAARANETGAIARESDQLLERRLPARQIESFRRDVRAAEQGLGKRVLTTDYGFNGSPFYAFLRRADPALHRPLGRETAWLNLTWQILATVVLVWLLGAALHLAIERRLAIGALLFASWDYAAYALPGLVFGELWLPIAVALLALGRGRGIVAGVAVAWATLIKLFPLVLALPAAVQLVTRGPWATAKRTEAHASGWPLRFVIAFALAVPLLGLAGLLSGRSWADFLHKVLVEFQSNFRFVNTVSRSTVLLTLGVHDATLSPILSLVAIGFLAAMFAHGGQPGSLAALPRRCLVLLAALGWVFDNWLNYYALVPCLLLPYYARDHRVGATLSAFGMAATYLLPDFNDPVLVSNPLVHGLKMLPYLLIPAWMVFLELREHRFGAAARRAAVIVVSFVALATALETWRLRTIARLERIGSASLASADAERALSCYRGQVRLDPWNGRARMYEAVALAELGRIDEARGAFARAAALAPRYAPAQDNYGRMLLMDGRVDEASAQLEKALSLSPLNVEIMLALARIRIAQGRNEQATAVLDRALELDPGNRAITDLRAGVTAGR